MRHLYLLLALVVATPVFAWERHYNPDRFPSVGVNISKGHLPGMHTDSSTGPRTDGGFIRNYIDFKFPVTDALTLSAFGEHTGINNNLQFSNGTEIGLGVRFYIQ